MKTGLLCLFATLVLVSCTSPPDTAGEPGKGTGTTTLAQYWDHLPPDTQPEGGWVTYQNEKLGFAFQYPALYDELDCGKIFVEEKDLGENAYTLIGFSGGTIRIRIFSRWDESLAEYASYGKTPAEFLLLTAVEQFMLDGVIAHRHIQRIPKQEKPAYVKVAMAIHGDRLYNFQYNHKDLVSCDAPPWSEEAVYEYLVLTFEFMD